MARKVHGYSDALLSGQDSFATWAPQIRRFLCDADLIVAHNASFDCGFLDREFVLAGLPAIDRPSFCTMAASANRFGISKLEEVSRALGFIRAAKTHCAAEDAWLALMVFCALRDCPYAFPRAPADLAEPINIRAIQAKGSPQPASRTGRACADTPKEAERIDVLVEQVRALAKARKLPEAEALLLPELDRQEASARQRGWGVAPWWYAELARVYARMRRPADELAVLERYEKQPKAPGAMVEQLKELLETRRSDAHRGVAITAAIEPLPAGA